MIINQAALNALYTGFNTLFQQGFDSAVSQYNQVAMEVPSNTKSETYGWLGKTTSFRLWLGERVIQSLAAHSYTIFNQPFENTIGVDRDDIEDDTLGVYSPLMQMLGQDAKTHPDTLIFPLLKNGFSQTCYDGQYFFDSDHPVGSTTVSNTGGGAGTAWYLLDVSKPVRPLIFQKRKGYKFVSMDQESDEAVFMRKQYRYGVDCRVNAGYGLWQLAYASKQTLNSTNYAAARAAMQSMVGDNGNPLNIMPNLLVVPPSLETAARTLLNAELIADGSTGGNTNIYRNTASLLVTPWIN